VQDRRERASVNARESFKAAEAETALCEVSEYRAAKFAVWIFVSRSSALHLSASLKTIVGLLGVPGLPNGCRNRGVDAAAIASP
jgi:hypothetical protein